MRVPTTALYELWGSGFVNRWHTHPHPNLRNAQDLTGAHSWRVAILVTMIAAQCENITKDELLADVMSALFHDADEVVTGDLAYPAKKKMPDVRDRLQEFGRIWLGERSVPDFPESKLVKLCDQLDAYLFMLTYAESLRWNAPWKNHRRNIEFAASEIGVLGIVKELMDKATEKGWF